MKKSFVALVAVLALVLTACTAAEEEAPAPTPAPAPVELSTLEESRPEAFSSVGRDRFPASRQLTPTDVTSDSMSTFAAPLLQWSLEMPTPLSSKPASRCRSADSLGCKQLRHPQQNYHPQDVA